mmetsp:Transcript_5648/g.13661  ORF Transcript_5648/g.13661 Transcript_5648/m.13661 type:complete len:141 (+) Transcript_5648:320-742(+)
MSRSIITIALGLAALLSCILSSPIPADDFLEANLALGCTRDASYLYKNRAIEAGKCTDVRLVLGGVFAGSFTATCPGKKVGRPVVFTSPLECDVIEAFAANKGGSLVDATQMPRPATWLTESCFEIVSFGTLNLNITGCD